MSFQCECNKFIRNKVLKYYLVIILFIGIFHTYAQVKYDLNKNNINNIIYFIHVNEFGHTNNKI